MESKSVQEEKYEVVEWKYPKSRFFERYLKYSERYNINVSLDKKFYRPGDTMYIRCVILHTFTNRPFFSVPINHHEIDMYIYDGTGREFFKGWPHAQRHNVNSFLYKLPKSMPGGEYTLKMLKYVGMGICPGYRKFIVKKYTPPKLKKEITFLRKSYSVNDKVSAVLSVRRSDGEFCDPENTKIEARVVLDNDQIFEKTEGLKLSKMGKCQIEFVLPAEISEGIGTLSCKITEGVTETASKTLPIVLKKLKCFVYPEGGDLLNDVLNGVYVECFTPTDEPGDLEAELMEKHHQQQSVKSTGIFVKSVHEGRAYFEFTPRKGHTYHLKVMKPSGIDVPVEVGPLKDGVCMRLLNKFTSPSLTKEKIKICLSSSMRMENAVHVALFKREKCIQMLKIPPLESKEEKIVELDPMRFNGVLRVTVYDHEVKRALCERILFRRQRRKLNFEFSTTIEEEEEEEEEGEGEGEGETTTEQPKPIFTPRSKVKLKLNVRDDIGRPVRAYMGLTITDDSVHQMEEKRKRSPNLESQHFLENEVKNCELYDSESFFREEEEEESKEEERVITPDEKVDLLCGTQGWRRYVYKPIEESETKEIKDTKKYLDGEGEDGIKRRSSLFCCFYRNDDASVLQHGREFKNLFSDVKKYEIDDSPPITFEKKKKKKKKEKLTPTQNAPPPPKEKKKKDGIETKPQPQKEKEEQKKEEVEFPPPSDDLSKREKKVYLAKAAEQKERYKEMYQHMKEMIIEELETSEKGSIVEISVEERNLLSVSMKNIIGDLRVKWRNVYQQLKQSQSEELANVKKKIEEKIFQSCDDIIDISQRLINSCIESKGGGSPENLCFMYKLIGDYYRYECEVKKSNLKKEEEKKQEPEEESEKSSIDLPFEDLKEKAKEAYKKSGEHASKLPTTHPLRLGLKLNLSVFCYEILEDGELAMKIAKGSFEDAIEELDTLTESEYSDSTLIMQLLKDNLTLWTSAPPPGDNKNNNNNNNNNNNDIGVEEEEEQKEQKEKEKEDGKEEGEEEGEEGEVSDTDSFVDDYPDPSQFADLPYLSEFAYSPSSSSSSSSSTREEFIETIVFLSYQQTDKNGYFEYSFHLSDSITSYRVFLDAWLEDGTITSDTSGYCIPCTKSFFIEPKWPNEVSMGDTLHLPCLVVNNNNKKFSSCEVRTLSSQNDVILIDEQNKVIECGPLQEYERRKIVVKNVKIKTPESLLKFKEEKIRIEGRLLDGNIDKVSKTLEIVPNGIKKRVFRSGRFSGDDDNERGNRFFQIVVPKEVTDGSFVSSKLTIYPSILTNLDESLTSLIRLPTGCFEQTSSTLYPMICVLKLLQRSRGKCRFPVMNLSDEMSSKANEYVEAGYNRLLEYECRPNGGFSWFVGDGGGEGSVELTAMGLLEFHEMLEIGFPVDQKMIRRSISWMIDEKIDHEKQKFKLRYYRDQEEEVDYYYNYHPGRDFSCQCYACYAIGKIGREDLMKKVKGVVDQLIKGFDENIGNVKEDSYIIAMFGLTLFLFGEKEKSLELANMLKKKQDEDGVVKDGVYSICYSYGSYLDIETTSLAVMLFLKHLMFDHADRGISWISSKCEGGRFGSTQSTVRALNALVEFAESRGIWDGQGGLVGLSLTEVGGDGPKVKFEAKVEEEQVGALTIFEDNGDVLQLGKVYDFEVDLKSDNEEQQTMNFIFEMEYLEVVGDGKMGENDFLSFSTKLLDPKKKRNEEEEQEGEEEEEEENPIKKNSFIEGDFVPIKISIKNKNEKERSGMICIELNLPSGLTPRFENLTELKTKKTINHFELQGSRKLVLYLTSLGEGELRSFRIETIAEFPGVYKGLPSKAYLYYGDFENDAVLNEPLECSIDVKM